MPDGSVQTFGNSGLEAHWYIRDKKAMARIARDWEFELGQTYIEGGWHTGESELEDLLAVLRLNFSTRDTRRWYTPLMRLYLKINNVSRNYSNISRHYDVKEEVFRKFLDKEMFYSCAYFKQRDNTLEQAQIDKAELIAGKLMLAPGQKVLDIGSGWGSLAFHLAQHYSVEVTGITLSKEQLRVSREEAAKRGLKGVSFELADYREHQGSYDRIVSVGMLEHVGIDHLRTYFRQVKKLLKDDGIALIHSIGNADTPRETNPWIDKYIFPGGRIPTLSEMAQAVEQSAMFTTDVEVLRLHYAWTLHAWLDRFRANRQEILASMGEEFCRMWEFYLAACEAAFEYANLVVYQFQLARRHGVVPVTRDYLLRRNNRT